MWQAFCKAIGLFSIFPIPSKQWKKDDGATLFLFLPLIGMAMVGFFSLWSNFCQRVGIGGGMFAAGCTVLPIVVSGGIHMDGFLDVLDARYSRLPRQEKLRILADPHIGAFAAMGGGVYLILTYGAWSQIYEQPQSFQFLGVVFSRTLGALGAICLPKAKSSGMLVEETAGKKPVMVLCLLWMALGLLCLFLLWKGGWAGLLTCASVFLFAVWFCFMTKKEFGGTTGDLAGYGITMCELIFLLSFALWGRNEISWFL